MENLDLMNLQNSPRDESCWYMRMSYRLQTREQMHYVLSIYAALTMAVSIVIPTVAMLICSLLIIKQFTFKVGLYLNDEQQFLQ